MTEAIFVKFLEDAAEFKKGEIYTTHQKGLNNEIKGIISNSDAELYLEYKFAEKVEIRNSEEKRIDDRTIFRLNIAQDLAIPNKRRDVTEALAIDFMERNFVHTTMNDDNSEIWIYHNGIYIPNGKSLIYEYVRDITNKAYTTTLANEVISKIMADTFINEQEFYNTNYPDLIPVQNGILNIKTKKLLPYEPSYIFFGKLPVSYNPSAKCPEVLRFLNQTQKNDEKSVKLLLEIAGYCLFKSHPIHKWFLFHGIGRNGKGAYFRLLEALIGKENVSAIPIQELEEKEFALAILHGKYMNIGGDIPAKPLKSTARIKAVTGEDYIQANRKFKSHLGFVSYAKQLHSANELPKVMDFSDGFFDRIILLDWKVKFVEKEIYHAAIDKSNLQIKDPTIEQRIHAPEELSGFLNLALENLEHVLERGHFSYTLGVDEVRNRYLRRSDNVVAFFQDCCTKEYHEFTTKDDFREKYLQYCDDRGLMPKSDKEINHTLQEKLGIAVKTKTIPVENGIGDQEFQQKRVWVGVKLNE